MFQKQRGFSRRELESLNNVKVWQSESGSSDLRGPASNPKKPNKPNKRKKTQKPNVGAHYGGWGGGRAYTSPKHWVFFGLLGLFGFFGFLGFEPSKAGGHLAIQNIGFLARNIGFCTFGLSKTLVF